MYILVAVSAILIVITEVIVGQVNKSVYYKPVNNLLIRILARIIQICRYIILWYYCIDQLRFDTKQESESTIEINIRDDRVDLSKFTEKEIEALAI